jgi:hypothetical protein
LAFDTPIIRIVIVPGRYPTTSMAFYTVHNL